MPREPAWLTSAGMDAEAQAASRERRPGRPQRSSGDGARAAPTHGNPGWTENTCRLQALQGLGLLGVASQNDLPLLSVTTIKRASRRCSSRPFRVRRVVRTPKEETMSRLIIVEPLGRTYSA